MENQVAAQQETGKSKRGYRMRIHRSVLVALGIIGVVAVPLYLISTWRLAIEVDRLALDKDRYYISTNANSYWNTDEEWVSRKTFILDKRTGSLQQVSWLPSDLTVRVRDVKGSTRP